MVVVSQKLWKIVINVSERDTHSSKNSRERYDYQGRSLINEQE